MSNRTVALVPAAGRGLRMGGSVPKQFLSLGHQPLILHSLRVLQASPVIQEIILAVPHGDMDYCLKEIVAKHHFTKVTKVVPGGAERQDSVRHALEAVQDEVDLDSRTQIIATYPRRLLVRDTDRGQVIQSRIDALRALLEAYQSGSLKEAE